MNLASKKVEVPEDLQSELMTKMQERVPKMYKNELCLDPHDQV